MSIYCKRALQQPFQPDLSAAGHPYADSKTPFGFQLDIVASQSIWIQDVFTALRVHFVNIGRPEWTDGKLLWDWELLTPVRSLRSYADEAKGYGEAFGPFDWMLSQCGD